MKVEDYEYSYPSEDYEITEERQKKLISELKDQIKKGKIAHFKILAIGQNDEEYDFMYDWLDKNNIIIRGIDGTISGEIPNFEHIPKMGQSYLPEADLTHEEAIELFKQMAGENPKERKSARDKLIVSNMRLAKWVANWEGINALGIQEEDKDQMAMIGLMNAVDKFDWTKGYRFSTYACKAIYRRIVREWYTQNPINARTMEQLDNMKMTEEEFFSQLGRQATKEEIAQIMGISVKKVTELQSIRDSSDTRSLDEISDSKVDFEEVVKHMSDGDRIERADEGYISEGVYLDEKYAIPYTPRGGIDTQYEFSINALKQQINYLLETLTQREADVLRMRFGMNDGSTHTLEEVAAVFGVTRERIREIENKAIRKMRHPSRAKKIKDFFTEDLGFEI